MFSWEINELMMKRKYNITPIEYYQICDKSPQITHIHYESFSNKYRIYTNDGYEWEFTIRRD